MLRITHFIILWNLICSLPLFAQEYSYVNYNTREGLAGSVVYSMVQDHDGFMWFGTETGLSRFDGTRFKNFTTSDGLPDNEIIKLFVDSKNRVWIAPFKNTMCYYWRGRIYNAENDSVLSRIKLKGELKEFAENDSGDIAILAGQSVSVIWKNGKVLNIDSVMGLPIVAGFWAGKLGDGLFGVDVSAWTKGVYRLEISSDGLRSYRKLSGAGNAYKTFYYSDNLQISKIFDSLRILYPKTGEVLKIRNPSQFTSYSLLNDSMMTFNSSKVEVFNFHTKKIERVLLDGKHTSDVRIDREGNMWFTTLGDGVYRLASLEYRNYFLTEGEKILPVFSLLKSGDTIFAGSTASKIWTIDNRTGKANAQILDYISNTPGRLTTLNKLQGGDLLAGTDQAMIRIKRTGHEKSRDIYQSVKSTHLYGDSLLIGQSIAAVVLNINNLKSIDTAWAGRTTAVFRKSGRYFIGTLQGLYIVDDEGKREFAGNLHASLKSRISAICEDSAGNIWIATNGSGVTGYRDGRIFAWINKDSGLTSNICRSILATDYLWIGTEQGLNKVSIKDNSFKITPYTTSDGLLSNVINAIWVEGSMVYLATPKGITFFDESKVNTNSMCALKITSVQSTDQRWAYDTAGLVFDYSDRDIRVEFAGISFKSGGEIVYKYRLRGLNEDWQQTNDNFLNYASLPSGTYKLELQATNKFGVTSNMATLQFIIKKPFWEKNWFRLLILVVLAAAIWKFIHYRIQLVRRQHEQDAATNRKIAELEQMALKAQMNPHFIFNCLHSIQQYVMDKDIRGANKFITDFARLIRLTLNMSMQPKISIQDEINYISTYLELEKARLEEKFSYSVDVSNDIAVDAIYIPAMILQPFVENCVRHGVSGRNDNNGLITVSFCIKNNYLFCTIEDNGPGRKATLAMKSELKTGHDSKGMRLTQSRIDILNKNLEQPIVADIEDIQYIDEISGTRVTIRFPLEEAQKLL